ncbi:hypothetical protein K438DRAFT_2087267 [Mycena galopus ATCC 62051]|nr:hypothetical protein K438DRAFT_2087267 [Mycena galopus ATCC 62051]
MPALRVNINDGGKRQPSILLCTLMENNGMHHDSVYHFIHEAPARKKKRKKTKKAPSNATPRNQTTPQKNPIPTDPTDAESTGRDAIGKKQRGNLKPGTHLLQTVNYASNVPGSQKVDFWTKPIYEGTAQPREINWRDGLDEEQKVEMRSKTESESTFVKYLRDGELRAQKDSGSVLRRGGTETEFIVGIESGSAGMAGTRGVAAPRQILVKSLVLSAGWGEIGEAEMTRERALRRKLSGYIQRTTKKTNQQWDRKNSQHGGY